MKKAIAIVLAVAMILVLVPMTALAADSTVGDAAALATAVANATGGETITLSADITVSSTIAITKNLTLDLNGHELCVPGRGSSNLYVTDGTLSIIGTGRIYEAEDNRWLAPVIIEGTADGVNVGPNVTLEGWAGIMVDYELTTGPIINLEGKINAYDDKTGGTGCGIYLNGSFKNQTTYPIFNIKSTAIITSTGSGIYAAGYAKWNIAAGSSITGVESAIGIKAGTLNISGGTLSATGAATIPTEGFSDGINGSGCAIQIESNDGYAGNIVINIIGGTITSVNGYAIYEYLDLTAPATTGTKVTSISISGGSFHSSVDVDTDILTSSELAAADPSKLSITGGIFSKGASTDVSAAVDPTYTIIIPASVDFGTLTKGTAIVSQPFNVTASGVLIEAGAHVDVNVNSNFTMYAGTADLPYSLYQTTTATAALTDGAQFASFNAAGGTQYGRVDVDTSNIDSAGSYAGTMVFTIAYVG